MNTYKINEFEQVVPYTSGRRCNDTRAWRDATELELQQQEEIRELKEKIEELERLNDGLQLAIWQKG